MSKHLLQVCRNAEGSLLAYLSPIKEDGSTESGYRIAGPKGWGGTVAIANLEISESDLKKYVDEYTTTKSERVQPVQKPVETELETQQFNCFHVSAEDFEKLKALPVGTRIYTQPPAEVVRELVKSLEYLQYVVCASLRPDEALKQVRDTLNKAKEHGL